MVCCSENAYAKINLSLAVTGKRTDGYHYISSVMQTVGLHDTLRLRRGESGITVRCSDASLPTDKKNLAVAAAYAFFRAAGREPAPLIIELEKRIPAMAGLGGGSADAAAALRLCNRAFKAGLSFEQLRAAALEVGSDVPFCVEGGTALVEGVGEIIRPLASLPPLPAVLVTPQLQVPTGPTYARLDEKMRGSFSAPSPDFDPTDRFFAAARNDFEKYLCPQQTVRIIGTMREFSPLMAAMSGSGPSAFALFDSRKQALRCAEKLRADGYIPCLTRLKRP